MINLTKKFRQDGPTPGATLLPLLPLRDIVVFPHMVAPLFVGRSKSVKALADAMNNEKNVFLATQKKIGDENPDISDISLIGTIGKVLQLLRLPDGTVKALVEGKSRARIMRFIHQEDFFQVEIEPITDEYVEDAEGLALGRAIINSFHEYADLTKNISKDLLNTVSAISNLSQLSDTVSAHFSFKIENKQHLLEADSLNERLAFLLSLIKMEIDAFQMDQRIKNRVKEQMEKTQKSYYLNEQMRAIKKEMGADEDAGDDLKEIENLIPQKKMSMDATDKALHEF